MMGEKTEEEKYATTAHIQGVAVRAADTGAGRAEAIRVIRAAFSATKAGS